MCGVDEKLNYLLETKELIKNAINSTGGMIDDDTPFNKYYEPIQTIIDTFVIPQSDLDELVSMMISLNGVN